MLARFVVSAAGPGQFPSDGLAEIALLGRSNVGKSSLLNALAGQRGLAFTSRTPGRTQAINFYRITPGTAEAGRSCYFVDLPGYGYARVPRGLAGGWKQLVETYLLTSRTLALSLLILDARRGWTPMDRDLKRWLEFHNRRFLVIVTKMDKLNQSEQTRGLAEIRKEFPSAVPFSAATGRGVRETWQAIQKTHQSP